MPDYDEQDFAQALAVLEAEPSPARLAERLGIDWDYLVWLALGLSDEMLDDADLVGRGAEAFTAGFLVGVHLPEPHGDLGKKLAFAVDHVRRRGRHAIIADHCDLSAVASFEQAYAGALVEALELDDERREAVARLFESGLATGLVLGALA
jgi:hypothetical protein